MEDSDRERLIRLEARIAEQDAIISELRSRPGIQPGVAMRGLGSFDEGTTDSPGASAGAVGRRAMLSKLGMIAAGGTGLAVGGILATSSPATAATGDGVVLGEYNTATSFTEIDVSGSATDVTAFYGVGAGAYAGLRGDGGANGGMGVQANGGGAGSGTGGPGLQATGGPGNSGGSDGGPGVLATGGAAGAGSPGGGPGVSAVGTDLGAGVVAQGGFYGTGVVATGGSGANYCYGGMFSGTAAGSVGLQGNGGAGGAGVIGYSGTGSGDGVVGTATTGRGGVFRSNAAQVQLLPGSKSTHPTKGQAGDLFVDSKHDLWFCKGGSTWVQLA